MNVGVCGAGIFALLDCLPGMAFTLTLFRKRVHGVDGDTVAGVMGISCDRFDS